MADLFEAAGLTPEAPSPAGRPAAARSRWTRSWARITCWGPSGPIRRMAEAQAAGLDDPLGPARHRQDHHRAPAGQGGRLRVPAALGGVLRRRRPEEGLRDRPACAALAGQATLLFVDEIHRFNRAQQDGFLPFVEEGIVTLVGATTENPSFELNGALLSRCQVFVLKRLDDAALETLLEQGRGASRAAPLPLEPEARAGADRAGRRRRPLPADPGRDPVQHRHRPSRSTTDGPGPGAAEAQPRLRQGPRGALQPHLRPA